MRSPLREYAKLVWGYWYNIVLGLAFTFLGALRDVGVNILVPSWVWYLFAFGAFAFAQFMAFAQLHKEVTNHRSKPRPDMPLRAVKSRVFSFFTPADADSPLEYAELRLLEQIRLGNIIVFGTRTNPDEDDGPLEEIPLEYWEDANFKFYQAGRGEAYENKRTQTIQAAPIYFNLQASQSQVDLCWPLRRRLRFQLPFRHEAG